MEKLITSSLASILYDQHIKSNNTKSERWAHEILKTVTRVTPHKPTLITYLLIQFIQITRFPKLAVHFKIQLQYCLNTSPH